MMVMASGPSFFLKAVHYDVNGVQTLKVKAMAPA